MPADSVVASGLCENAGAMLERSGSGFALSRSGVRAATELAAASARSIGVCCRRCDPEGVDDEWSVSPCFSKCLRATNAAPIKAETPAKMPNICPVENGVAPLSFAAIAAGADGLMIEVHPTPSTARSDAEQSLTPDEFTNVMTRLRAFAAAAGRTMAPPNVLHVNTPPDAVGAGAS